MLERNKKVRFNKQFWQTDKHSLSNCISGNWGPNISELNQKFAPEHTNGEGPQWIRNLYFLYLVELRALVKASVYLEQEEYYTGSEREDSETREAISNFLHIAR